MTARGYRHLLGLIETGSRVLDLGCGDGELLDLLRSNRGVRGRGVDIEEGMVLRCISRGLSVFQGNLDEGLKDYSNGSYDYVILNSTLQVVRNPLLLLREMLRVGRKAVVNFPNFGYLPVRLQLLLRGRMPVTKSLPYQWYDTPNIHLCTRKDFMELCRELEAEVLLEVDLSKGRRVPTWAANFLAAEVCCVIRSKA